MLGFTSAALHSNRFCWVSKWASAFCRTGPKAITNLSPSTLRSSTAPRLRSRVSEPRSAIHDLAGEAESGDHPPSSAGLQSITQGYAMTAEGAGTLFPYQWSKAIGIGRGRPHLVANLNGGRTGIVSVIAI